MTEKLLGAKNFIVVLSTIAIASISPISNAGWIITSIGRIPGYLGSATGINDLGQVVGYSFDHTTRFGSFHAFTTGPNGKDVSIPDILGGESTYISSINNSGQMVGSTSTDNRATQVFFFDAFITGANGIGITRLEATDGARLFPVAINDSGQVVGSSDDPRTGEDHAFITGPNGAGLTYLESPDGVPISVTGINNFGQVIGYSYPSNGPSYAFITGPNGVGFNYLESLVGSTIMPRAVNNSGEIVGGFHTPGSPFHSFITGINGIGFSSLVLPPEGSYGSYAYDINDLGDVVGVMHTEDLLSRSAFFYSQGVTTNLSLLPSVIAGGWTDLNPRAINNFGQIVGFGTNGSDQFPSPFLLTYVTEPLEQNPEMEIPLPEPGTLLLTSLGLLGFRFRHRKHRYLTKGRRSRQP
ncbi:PEP-CTERM protein-sorting domain-containing protein [Nitrosospira multiformis]|uniref:PEP-CTERM protein-sorting domain-containing protein n=1 Tax=Nitrosospira multiformis TaxID=1231 RepID=A0A1H8KIA8_9PROT|nr:HAF repeat/PEP-CTERM domain-containing protein [Nitrosospira multiformis]SEN92431.1 PEP-CTERM protein-sorting domain-containing protein [Nitrosospira multiformis]